MFVFNLSIEKYIMKRVLILSILFSSTANAQIIDRLGRKLEQKAIQKAEQAIDKSFEKKNKKEVNSGETSKEKNTTETNSEPQAKASNSESGFSVTSKFDFVQGEKVLYIDDFASDNIGDFPAKWNTNASGEIVKISNSEDKWFSFTNRGAFTPDFIEKIPENATIEFDLMASPNYGYNNPDLQIAMVNIKDKNDYLDWQRFDGRRKGNGFVLLLHPQGAGSEKHGRSEVQTYQDGRSVLSNQQSKIASFNHNHTKAHIAIWRQNQRIRVYVGEQKVWDLPRALNSGENLNSLIFSLSEPRDDQYYFISNLRVATGQPDTRNKLMDTGSFTTSGIRFKTNSAEILAESHGVIKEIADVMKENQDLKIKIVGHTDASGNDAQNQTLSEKRAESVKNYLKTVFSIDEKRMKTEGKGSSQAIDDNSTAEGKANNRRVEFIKE